MAKVVLITNMEYSAEAFKAAALETKKQLQTVKSNRSHVKIDMPEYMKKQKEEGLPQEKKASEEQIKEFQELQRKIKERRDNGKG